MSIMKKQNKGNEIKLKEMISALTEKKSYSLSEMILKSSEEEREVDLCDIILPGVGPFPCVGNNSI